MKDNEENIVKMALELGGKPVKIIPSASTTVSVFDLDKPEITEELLNQKEQGLRTLYHRYETNNWLKAHHMPMRRAVPKRYLKNSSAVTHLQTLELLPYIIGPNGTGKTTKFISPNILSNKSKTDEEE